MKKIQDYLPLYMGCDLDTSITGDYIHPYGALRIEKLDMRSISDILWALDKKERDIKGGFNDSDHIYCKPILRQLNDMTEEEEAEMVATQDEVKLEGYPQILLRADSGETFRYMLSKGFDLFDLIPEGLAIDSKTLK